MITAYKPIEVTRVYKLNGEKHNVICGVLMISKYLYPKV